MKVVAQSTVPSTSPYLHVGYISATTVKLDGPFLLLGGTIALIGAFLAYKIRIGKSQGVFTKYSFERRGTSRRRKVGVFLAVLGLVLIGFGAVRSKRAYHHPHAVTSSHASGVAFDIAMHIVALEPIPENIRALGSAWEMETYRLQDGWFRDLEVRKVSVGDQIDYLVVSAGPDGKLDTEDDFVLKASEFLDDCREIQERNRAEADV